MDKDKNKTKGGSHAAKKPRKSADTPAAARTRRKTESAPAAPRTPRRRKKSRIGIMVAVRVNQRPVPGPGQTEKGGAPCQLKQYVPATAL